jgi:hypothetical protein
MRLTILFAIIFSLAYTKSNSQQHAKIAAYNVAFGALTGGVGSAINKKSNESLGHAFLNGLWKGAIGGGLTYSGKRAKFLITKNNSIHYGWGAKLIHTTGASILENASANRPIFSNWAIEYAFIRLDIGKKTLLRVQPFALTSFTRYALNYKINVSKTLQTGTTYFETSEISSTSVAAVGANSINSVVINDINKQTFAHEMVHTLQNREYLAINFYGKKIDGLVKHKSKIYTSISKYVFLDYRFQSLIREFAKVEINNNASNYYSNFIEFEAESLSSNHHIKTH